MTTCSDCLRELKRLVKFEITGRLLCRKCYNKRWKCLTLYENEIQTEINDTIEKVKEKDERYIKNKNELENIPAVVYCIECNITGQKYYGSTIDYKNRIRQHKSKNNKCSSKYIIERGDYKCYIVEKCNCFNRYNIEQNYISNDHNAINVNDTPYINIRETYTYCKENILKYALRLETLSEIVEKTAIAYKKDISEIVDLNNREKSILQSAVSGTSIYRHDKDVEYIYENDERHKELLYELSWGERYSDKWGFYIAYKYTTHFKGNAFYWDIRTRVGYAVDEWYSEDFVWNLQFLHDNIFLVEGFDDKYFKIDD
jgi:hypothetical protein